MTSASVYYHTELYSLIRLQVVSLDANWGNSPDNTRYTPSYIGTLTNAPIIFNVGLQGLAAQSTMEAELTAAAPTMKGTVFCFNMMLKLGFDESFDSVPLHIDNTSVLHVVGNRTYSLHAKYIALRCTLTYSPRSKHIALRYYFFVQELVGQSQHPLRQERGLSGRIGHRAP